MQIPSRTRLYTVQPRLDKLRYSAAMALYEYRCPAGHTVEVFHKMDEAPEVLCPSCGASTERVIGPPMIHTQYYFSPQVHGARRPRHRPATPPRRAPAAPTPPASGADATAGED